MYALYTALRDSSNALQIVRHAEMHVNNISGLQEGTGTMLAPYAMGVSR